MIDELLYEIKELWYLLVGAAGAVTWLVKWRLDKQKNINLLYLEYEQLQVKIINNIKRAVKDSATIAEQRVVLDRLKLECPECYQRVIKEMKLDDRLDK